MPIIGNRRLHNSKVYTKPRAQILVIPSTHWDRAWFWPFERFRIKLIEMWCAVKEMWGKHPGYTFSSDGQTLCVEDYLEIFPEDRELFREMGRQGRFRMGPMYCLCDFYCVGGESVIRNLLIGIEQAKELDALESVIYSPDTFGHVPCLPMLCRGFGFDTYVFMRGINNNINAESRFWFWESPDGSRVQVFRLRDGYGNAARLGLHKGSGELMDRKSSGIKPRFKMDLALEQILQAVERQTDIMGAPYVLLAGVDHQIPQRELPEVLQRAEDEKQDISFSFGSWEDVAAEIREKDSSGWQTYCGELHGDFGAASILGGTVSSRIYLKQRNAACERLLLNAEAMDAAVSLLGKSDPAGVILKHAWKTLLKCQPHDNITGCSVDSVHREDEANFARVEQEADAVIRRMANRLIEIYGGQSEDDDRYAFFLFNWQSVNLNRNIIIEIDHEGRFSWGDMPVHAHYDIVDEDGNPMPFREISRERGAAHPHPVLIFEMNVNLPPFSFKRFFIEPKEKWNKTNCGKTIENEFLKIKINHNGTVDITDKTNGKEWKGIGFFSDQADCGDEYDFSHIRGDKEILFDKLNLSRSSQNGFNGMQFAELHGKLRIPESSTPEGRSAKFAEIPFTLAYTLCPGQRQLDVCVRFKNNAYDHRLRMNLPLPFMPEKSRAGLKFSEVERPCGERVVKENNGKNYIIDPVHPADQFIAVNDPSDNGGIAFFSEFPCNYEVLKAGRPRIAVTILRAVGILSCESLTRGAGAGPETLTPDAQCLGREFNMRFGIRPFSGNQSGDIFSESVLWRQKPVFGLIMGFDPPRNENMKGDLFKVCGSDLIVSSFKSSHVRDGRIILRFFNPHSESRDVEISSTSISSFQAANLNEESISDPLIKSQNGSCRISIPSYGLKTVVLHDMSPKGKSATSK